MLKYTKIKNKSKLVIKYLTLINFYSHICVINSK